jgi:conjugal transfer ATP-binding protein TraC
MQGTKVIVIDPEREYKQLAKSVNGTYIRLSSTSKEKINPFDYSLTSVTGENVLAEHIQSLTELISLMVGSLTSEERAVVDKALLLTYKHLRKSRKRTGLSQKKSGTLCLKISIKNLKR